MDQFFFVLILNFHGNWSRRGEVPVVRIDLERLDGREKGSCLSNNFSILIKSGEIHRIIEKSILSLGEPINWWVSIMEMEVSVWRLIDIWNMTSFRRVHDISAFKGCIQDDRGEIGTRNVDGVVGVDNKDEEVWVNRLFLACHINKSCQTLGYGIIVRSTNS